MASNVGQKAYEIFLFFGGGKQQQLHSIICSCDSSRSLGFVSVKLSITENKSYVWRKNLFLFCSEVVS